MVAVFDPHAPAYDWGVLQPYVLHGWITTPGSEWLVADPYRIPALEGYCKNLPNIAPAEGTARYSETRHASQDIFASLPAELTHILLDFMPVSDVLSLRRASSSVRGLDLDRLFWKTRFSQDLPFVFELRDALEDQHASSIVDWESVYKHVNEFGKDAANPLSLGLQNRSRIWDLVGQIVMPYFHRLSLMKTN